MRLFWNDMNRGQFRSVASPNSAAALACWLATSAARRCKDPHLLDKLVNRVQVLVSGPRGDLIDANGTNPERDGRVRRSPDLAHEPTLDLAQVSAVALDPDVNQKVIPRVPMIPVELVTSRLVATSSDKGVS